MAKEKPFTEEELQFMKETYGRVLTRAEFEERRERFVGGEGDVSYDKDGVMRIGMRIESSPSKIAPVDPTRRKPKARSSPKAKLTKRRRTR